MKEITVLTPSGCIGNLGINEEWFWKALDEYEPDVIAVDAGSYDPGPHLLAQGIDHGGMTPVPIIPHDIDICMRGAMKKGIPFITGSAGGSGAKSNLALFLHFYTEIAKKHNFDFQMGVVPADVNKEYLKNRLRQGDEIEPWGWDHKLTEDDIDRAGNIVAMMGYEPTVECLKRGAQVILCGRQTDHSQQGSYPIFKGSDKALSLHAGDIIECAETALKEIPEGIFTSKHWDRRIPTFATIKKDHILIYSGHPNFYATVDSVAGHAAYERASMSYSGFPGGILDKTKVKYEQFDERTVKVYGTKVIDQPYKVLLEGAGIEGYRYANLIGIRTPRMIMQIDDIIQKCKEISFNSLGIPLDAEYPKVHVHMYGKNGVLGKYEFWKEPPNELLLIVDVISQKSPEEARLVNGGMPFWWFRYPGKQTTAGNIARLPMHVEGLSYKTYIHHLMPLEDPLDPELFPITVESVRSPIWKKMINYHHKIFKKYGLYK